MALTGKQIQGVIQAHRTKSRAERRDWDRWRSWYTSDFWGRDPEQPTGSEAAGGEEDNINFETNYPYAFIDTMIANVCPQNPQVTVMARREVLYPAAQFREALINDVMRRNNLHLRLWKAATHTSICGRGFIKTVWNFNKKTSEIFAIDPRYVFFDMSAAKWEDIRYLVEVTVLTEAEFKGRTKRKGKKGATYNAKVAKKANFSGYPAWLKDHSQDSTTLNEASREVYKWVTVYEVYDLEGDGRYYHYLDDIEEPLFEGELPYRYVKNPFQMMTFNDNMTDLAGLSDVKLIQSIQERLNEIDTLELWHAHTSNPVLLVQAALCDNPEQTVSALAEANKPGSMVMIEGKANAPLRDIIGQTPMPQSIPAFGKMRERCNQVIEFILGIPQYSRGVVGVADVATEVALADTATRTRNGRRIKQVEDIVQDLSDKIVGLYEEFLDIDSKLPIRLTDSQRVLEVTRESLKLRSERDPSETSLDFDYLAIPYSPTENHRLVQLQKLQQYLPLLQQSPSVDQEKLVIKLLDLLQLQDIVAPPQPTPPPGMPGMGPPGPPGAMPPGPMGPPGTAGAVDPTLPVRGTQGMDTTATGALPLGIEPPPTPTPMGGPGYPAVGK